MNKKIAVLAGDGIGPEIMAEALKILRKIEGISGHKFEFAESLIGASAWEKYGEHFPKETVRIAENADAILFGSVGGPVDKQMEPKWKDCETNSILAIRKHFNFNVNLRPVKLYSALKNVCVLRPNIVEKGIDMLCVRELSQDVYFGKHETSGEAGMRHAFDEMSYDEKVIEAIAHAAFRAAMLRRKKVTSVDKANVLNCSKLWREVVTNVAKNYADCILEHVLVDNMSMQVIKRPGDFDVILMPNMFGDIISDEVSVFTGSLGMLPSASLNKHGLGLYEPSSGSAPDIAGKGIANPIGQILSAAMMLKFSFSMNKEHDAIIMAVEKTLNQGYRTRDIFVDNT
ncbi:3-isopropylmalate dehydrogenase, partial [Candidatus Peregrinibacteria bacterium]|nr:3-isopropylmalate dehydrogenase [Candidatus Peregrinibacteria bacterium]